MRLTTGSSAFTALEILTALLTALSLIVAIVRPALASDLFGRIERGLIVVGDRPWLGAALLCFLPLACRALLLPVYGVPTPAVHDEYGYLLQADTFASGRLTNPPLSLSKYFESIYILTKPTYTSQYPPLQGLLLGAARYLTGLPWLGVFASMGVLSGLLFWMLRAWVPGHWAFLGGLLGVMQFGILSYWMNSYFGGTLPAIGGTLVFGGLPRIQERPALNSGIVALGLAILLNSRPLEGLLLLLIAAVSIFHRVVICRELRFDRVFRLILAPSAAILLAAVGFTAFYNFRVTGNPWEMPYMLNRKVYGTPQGFLWQRPYYVKTSMPCDIRQEYEKQLQNHARQASLRGLMAATGGKLRTFWSFYLGPALTLPLIFIPFVRRGPELRIAAAALVVIALYNLTFFAYVPHYSAAVTGLILLVIVICFRRMRELGPSGVFLSRSLPLVCALTLAIPVMGRFAQAAFPAGTSGLAILWRSEFVDPWPRERLLADLLKTRGDHLVLVRYDCANHFLDNEWVFNHADIDREKVIWARELDLDSGRQLSQRFPGRKVWLAEPDAQPARITPFPSSQ